MFKHLSLNKCWPLPFLAVKNKFTFTPKGVAAQLLHVPHAATYFGVKYSVHR